MSTGNNPLSELSSYLEKAVARGGESTVLVNARRRFPASGIAYAADLILTAEHVIERDEEISVVLADGSTAAASIAGRDPANDLALLRLDKPAAKPAEVELSEVKVGKLVIALGRPSQEGVEASLGMVSSIGGPVRTGRGGLLEKYIRTDTTPFPGFSGGPLIDSEGKVVGLNTSGLAHGTAITIPTAIAWSNAESLVKNGFIKRGYLGIRSQMVDLSAELQKALGRTQEAGLLLVSVEPGSPAELGGLMVGDILVAVEGHSTADHDELMLQLSSSAVGKPARVQVLRGGQVKDVAVTIGERK